jgi:putative transposase
MPWYPTKPYHPPHVYLDNRVYFITSVVFDRKMFLKEPGAKAITRDCLFASVETEGIALIAWVILNNHYHVEFYVERKEQLVPFLRRFHSTSAIALNKHFNYPGRKVWRNYWDYCPRDEHDYYRVFNYIHANPLKHGLISVPNGWPLAGHANVRVTPGRVIELHEILLTYEFSSYPSYAQLLGDDGIANVWLDHPFPVSWEGPDS